MRLMGSVSGTECVASFPALRSKDFMTEAFGVVRPVGVLRVVRDLGTAVCRLVLLLCIRNRISSGIIPTSFAERDPS